MTNSIERADARAIPQAATRRAAIGALASVPALALPAIAIAAPPDNVASLDTELLALIDAERDLAPRVDAAEKAREEALERWERP